ncbi:DUF2500 domain-containing protein [Sporosarcina sp. Sa2YVA2]|uniref:DUF2500 domain-containing protein n=1 Tax=Sporosarcina quadrami TaxID=2762234 RepID=A0ABR8UE07_9BACL|nr:DUF2500 domain-containing protein [Sporosarcina quadrami]MBD7986273.1 DUF2500 domain-containing protein [Sporosarcina quadrami]
MGFTNFDGTIFSLAPIFIGIIFVIVIGSIIFSLVKGIGEWSTNNSSPRLTVPAQVITKRTNTWGGRNDTAASTDYYVTFQVESGDRMELKVADREYGMLAEGDFGILTFQGTRYGGFERKV